MDTQIFSELYFGETLENWLRFAALLILGLSLRRPISHLISRIACKLGKHEGERKAQFLALLRKPLSNLFLVVLCYVGFFQLDYIPTVEIFHTGSGATKKVFTIGLVVQQVFHLLMILLAASIFNKVAEFLFQYWIKKSYNEDEISRSELLPFIHKGLQFFIWLIAIFVILGTVFEMNVPALVASLGIGGVAIALAAKETVENTLASFIILADKPFEIGETIKTGAIQGTVEKIGFRSSRIRSASQTIIIVPNKKLVDNNLENLSERGKQKLTADFALGFGITEDKLNTVLQQVENMLRNNAAVLQPISVHLASFADEALQVQVGYFVPHPMPLKDLYDITQEVNKQVYLIAQKEVGGFAVSTPTIINTPVLLEDDTTDKKEEQ